MFNSIFFLSNICQYFCESEIFSGLFKINYPKKSIIQKNCLEKELTVYLYAFKMLKLKI